MTDREHYIKFVNDRPVSGRIYEGQDREWDYADQSMKALFSGVKSFATGRDLPVLTNFKFVE